MVYSKNIYFYSSLIKIEPILEKLHQMEFAESERLHLSTLLDSMLYHVIIDEILTNLSSEDKKTFLKYLHDNPRDEKILNFLQSKIENIEGRITRISDELMVELHKDIKEAKKN